MLLCYGNHVNPLNSFSKSANSLKAHMRDEQPPSLNHESLGLSNGQLLDGLRAMIRARAVDDRLWLLSRQGKAHFVITSAGHEATQFGCAWAVNIGRIMWCHTTAIWHWRWR